MSELKDRIKQVRKANGIATQKALSIILEVSDSRVKSLETGRVKEISALEANSMVNNFNLSLDWLLTGNGEMGNAKTVALPESSNELVHIPEFDIKLSAGHGAYPSEHALEIGARPFPMQWIKNKSLNPCDLKLVRVMGDSMEPLLKDKDMVMIDTSKTVPSEAMPFAIRFGEDLLVKTIQRLGNGNIALVSRNKDYNDIIIDKLNPPEEFHIIGAVIWHAHSWI